MMTEQQRRRIRRKRAMYKTILAVLSFVLLPAIVLDEWINQLETELEDETAEG